jgi:hypothetical protein
MKIYLILILTLLVCLLAGVLIQKKTPSIALQTDAILGSHQVTDSRQKLADSFSRQSAAERQRRVEIDKNLAKGAAGESESMIRMITQDILDKTRDERHELLKRWKLNEAQIARIEELQLEHWRMQYHDANDDYLARPAQIGDRSDTKLVEAHESKVQRAAGAAKNVFRMYLLATLGSPDRVEEYVQHEMRLVEKLARDARHQSDAAMGKSSQSED